MTSEQTCPNNDHLKALLDDTLPAEEQSTLEKHLETCSECRLRFERLASGGTLSNGDANVAEALDTPDTALEELKAKLKTEPQSETTIGESPGDAAVSLDFLAPSENPQSLGRLGRYDIRGVIGSGGMGIVLKAHDPGLNQIRAIKVLSPQLASNATARKRFLREAQKAAAVAHEHVVAIHAVDEQDHLPYIVMEYIVGVSLDERIKRSGSLKTEKILRIGMQTASGLAAAHAQGLVHRDIKPSNILLENGVERVKLADFGLARAIDDTEITGAGVVVGTPQYMSPEQARGEEVDHRSDLFGLGCVMYAMCTGRSPFRAATVVDAIRRVCDDTPRPIRSVNADIPEWLAEIIDQFLAKDPNERLQSANGVSSLLGEYLAHIQQPSQVAPPSQQISTQQRRRLPSNYRSVAMWSTACLAVALLVMGVWWLLAPASPRFHIVDLQPYANRFLTESLDSNANPNNLAMLEIGDRVVDDIPVRVGDRCIQLRGSRVPNGPEGVRGIRLGRTAAKIHFLHGCSWTHHFGEEVASYVFHYADGSTDVLPVVCGRHLLNWWHAIDTTVPATCAKTAWTGTNSLAEKKKCKILLYLCTWENPHPEKVIESVDFVRSDRPLPAPFCIGITCDNDPTPLPPEPGLLCVKIGSYFGAKRCSVAIQGVSAPPIVGKGTRGVLLPSGRHPVVVRDAKTVMRRGTVKIVPGAIVDLELDSWATLFPLPDPQPPAATELVGPSSGIWDAAISPDGKTIATAGGDGKLGLWRLERDGWTRRPALEAHDDRVWSIAFSPTDGLIATGSKDGTLKLWNLKSTQLVAVLKDQEQEVRFVVFSPDGEKLASGNGDGTIDIWSVRTHEKLASFSAHETEVNALAFSPNGDLLASGASGEGAVKLWDMTTKQTRHVMFGHTDAVVDIAFSPDGETVGSSSFDTTVKLWNTQSGEMIDSLPNPDGVFAVAFSPDGKRVAAGGKFQTVRVWDAASRKVLHDFHAHWDNVGTIAYSPDGETIMTAGLDNAVKLWPADDLPDAFPARFPGARPRYTFRVHEDWGVCAVFSPKTGGQLAAAGIVPTDLGIWNVNDFTWAARLRVIEKPLQDWMGRQSLAFTPDETMLITCLSNASRKDKVKIGLWDTRTRELRGAFETGPNSGGKSMWSGKVAISRDGTVLAVVYHGQRTFGAVNLTSGAELWTASSLHGIPTSIAISPDDRTVAVGTDLGKVMLIDASNGKELRKPLQHGTKSLAATPFSPEGDILASVGSDGLIRLWDLPS